MEKTMEAIYRNGAFHPLEPVSLDERQRVTVTFTDAVALDRDVAAYFTPEEWEEAIRDDVSLDDVRVALSTISGSLTDAVTSLRQER